MHFVLTVTRLFLKRGDQMKQVKTEYCLGRCQKIKGKAEGIQSLLGSCLTAKDVAYYLQVDAEFVRKHYNELGGMRLGRRILFFENLLVEAIRRNCGALQGEESEWPVEREGNEEEHDQNQAVQDKGRSDRLGGHAKKAAARQVLERDTHGIFNS
jgi:hypothetical protein